MYTETTIFIAAAAVAFVSAAIAIVSHWIKVDDATSAAEVRVRASLRELHAEAGDDAASRGAALAMTHTLAETAGALEAAPACLADDETALSRLFAGWGGAGMLLGITCGGVVGGPTGALLGGVAATTVSIGAVVVAVLVIDRVRGTVGSEARALAKA
jgi:hypothetical protein